MKIGPLTSTNNLFAWKSIAKLTIALGAAAGSVTAGYLYFSGEGEASDPNSPAAAGSAHTVEFDGTDDFLLVEDHPELSGGKSYTIEAWIKPLHNSLGGIVSKRKNNNDHCSYAVLVAPVRRSLRLYFKVNREDDDFYSRKEIPIDEWTHIAVVFDGEKGVHRRKALYINGELDKYGQSSSTKIRNFDTDFSIGKLINNNSSHFVGEIDEVRFWNKALEPVDIRAQMCQTLHGSESNLVGYWTFDELQGGRLRNKTTIAGLDASLQNMSDSSLIRTKACSYMN